MHAAKKTDKKAETAEEAAAAETSESAATGVDKS